MDVVPHARDPAPLKDEEKQRLLNALNDLGEPADDSAGTDHASDKVLTADEASGHTDHGPLDFFNNYNAFGTFERLGNDMSWTSTLQLWKITASTERHECHRLKMVKNRRLEKQVQNLQSAKGDTRQFRPSGRPPRHAFELRRTGEREIAEAMSCFGQTLQRFTFEMSTREAQAENNHAELDPSHCLIVKMFKTDIKLKKTPAEIRSFGRQILVRDADDTHFFENDLDGISLVSSVNTSDVIRLVVPKDPDLYGQLIGCIGTSAVQTMDLQGSHRQTVQIQDALCGAWTAVPIMYVGGKLHITHIDARQGTANVVWTDEISHIADIATCWWNPYQICATTSRPSCTMKLFDVRKMDTFLEDLEDMGLPERGELRYRHHPLHKDRHFESAWCMGKSPWTFSYCLGGYDLVFRRMGNAHGAHSSYHHDPESCGAFDSCEGCGAVRLENRAQSSLALVQYMANTGPTAVWLEHPQTYTTRSSMTSSPNDPADSNQSKMIDSFVGSILTAAVSDTSFAGDQVALKQGIVARMLENFEVGSDCCAHFPLLWSILQEEIRTSNPEVGASKAALLVLGGSCELRLTLSDAQFTVEVPPNALSSLDDYLDEQISDSCLIPLLLGTSSHSFRTKYLLSVLYVNKLKNRSGIGTFSHPKSECSLFFLFVCVDLMMFDVIFHITWWFQGWNAVRKASAQVSNFNNWMTSKRQFPAAV